VTGFGVDVLAFGPHPDDVELFVGGTTRKLALRGHRVALLDLTRGESATRGTPDVRAAEARAAAAVLGVERDQLGLPDGGVRADEPAQVEALVRYLRRRRPELVIAPWTEERHPDHEAAARLTSRATFLASAGGFLPALPRHVVRELVHYPLRVLGKPSFVVDISQVVEDKRRAIACHASQVGVVAGAASDVATLVASAGNLAAIETRDRYYGAQIGAAFAEPFIVRATLHLDDPLAHFRARPGAALLFEV
jgi:N-acetylglucosamine malate deacetylase 1